MNFLKGLGCFILSLLVAALLFAAVVGVVSLVKNIGFYDVLVSWFGHSSGFAKIINK